MGHHMNKINRKVEYALISLKHMRAKTPGELTTAKEIATLYGCPFDVISRVLQTLGKKGIVRSEQGAHGGYQLNKDLARVSFFELNEMILGRVAVAKCIHTEAGETPCEMRGTCNIVSPLTAFNRKLTEFYQSLSLADLLEPKQSRMTTPKIAPALTADRGI
jgi:Rrf2 family transcriptional regulator, nitric oxide-sensitive transcriptional repressor